MLQTRLLQFICYYLTSIVTLLSVYLSYFILGYTIASLIVILQIYWIIRDRLFTYYNLIIALVIIVAALLIDSALQQNSTILFKAPSFDAMPVPYWMIVLWISFSINLFIVTPWLLENNLFLGLFMGLGIPLGYWLGIKIGAADLVNDDTTQLAYWSIYWFITGGCISHLNRQLHIKEP